MTNKIANIARNTSYFTFALILQKIISFSYFTMIARELGPDDLGKYYFAISFTTIFAIFIDLGMANVMTREVAKDGKSAGSLLSNIIFLKIPLSILSLAILAIAINLLGYPELTRHLVYISSISMILDSFTLIFFSVARGFHNLLYESISSVVFQLIVLVSGIFMLRSGWGLTWLISALAFASAFNFFYSLLLVSVKWKVRILPSFDRALILRLISLSMPFALFAIYNRVYSFFDSVLLSYFSGDHYVGIYQVAFKIIVAIQFLPAAFIATLYPAMSSYWSSNRQQLAITFERAMNYLIIISVPITIGTIVLADKIVTIFKSGYSEAILPLQITMASNTFNFLLFPVGSLLNASDNQKKNTRIMGVIMVFSILLNLVLIPRFQAVGASATVFICTLLQFLAGFYLVPKIIEVRMKKIAAVFLKVALSGALMGLSAYYLKAYFGVFGVVGISGVFYSILLFLTGAFKKEDIGSIWRSLRIKEKEATEAPGVINIA